MKKIIASAAIITIAAFSAAPASAQMSGFKNISATTASSTIIHKTGRRGRVAAGIALGLIGAAVISSHARASYYDRDDREFRHERRCRRWRHWCRNGEDRACWKYDNRC